MEKILSDEVIGKRTLVTTESKAVQIPDAKSLVHLQFRRFAGCPFCSVHLQSFVRRHDEITAAGIREVVVFRSTTTALQHHHGNVPFAVIADPQDKLYAEFGVGSGLRALLNPYALLMALPNVMRMLPKLPGIPPWGKGGIGVPRRLSDSDRRESTRKQIRGTRLQPVVGGRVTRPRS